MSGNVVELKHGELNVKLLICTKSWRNTMISLEQDGIRDLTALASADALFRYAYYSYVAFCKKNIKTPEYDEFDFDELLNVGEVDSSNLEDVFKELSNSIISKVESATKEAEKKS